MTDAEHLEQYVADGMVASDARLDAAGALRRLGHAIVSHDPGDEFFHRVVDAIDGVLPRIEASPSAAGCPGT